MGAPSSSWPRPRRRTLHHRIHRARLVRRREFAERYICACRFGRRAGRPGDVRAGERLRGVPAVLLLWDRRLLPLQLLRPLPHRPARPASPPPRPDAVRWTWCRTASSSVSSTRCSSCTPSPAVDDGARQHPLVEPSRVFTPAGVPTHLVPLCSPVFTNGLLAPATLSEMGGNRSNHPAASVVLNLGCRALGALDARAPRPPAGRPRRGAPRAGLGPRALPRLAPRCAADWRGRDARLLRALCEGTAVKAARQPPRWLRRGDAHGRRLRHRGRRGRGQLEGPGPRDWARAPWRALQARFGGGAALGASGRGGGLLCSSDADKSHWSFEMPLPRPSRGI